MFKFITLIASIASAAAFAPALRLAKSSSLKMGFENAIGAQPPLGFWDPLGLLNDADQSRFDRLRYVETKHGRIAMVKYIILNPLCSSIVSHTWTPRHHCRCSSTRRNCLWSPIFIY